jgi:hypothetical protein
MESASEEIQGSTHNEPTVWTRLRPAKETAELNEAVLKLSSSPAGVSGAAPRGPASQVKARMGANKSPIRH